MKAQLIFLLLFVSLCHAATAGVPEMVVMDDLWFAMRQVGEELALGKDRQEIKDRLDQKIRNHPKGPHLSLAQRLSEDLSFSLTAALEASNHKVSVPLMETTLSYALISYSFNWPALEDHLEKHPEDPLVRLLRQGRSTIDLLLPFLRDPSPTHAYTPSSVSQVPRIPRVCDMALAAIEFHAKSRFRSAAGRRMPFHQLGAREREKIILHIEKWWAENKNKSVSEGILAQMPHVDLTTKIWMAVNLGKEGEESDREEAIRILRSIVRNSSEDYSVHAAKSLAKLGDFSSVEFFSARLAKLSTPPREIYSGLIFYLTDHGKRREWEMLHRLGKQELEQGLKSGHARIWPKLVNSRKAKTSPLAIPSLASALTQTEASGSRSIEGSNSPEAFSSADIAAENLQRLTGVEFGYRPGTSMEQRLAAIQKAQEWWNTEGRELYTYDYVESLADSGLP
ncbi:MAG: hypothetical protein AAGM22_25025 [Acidobacteriota bacterium]